MATFRKVDLSIRRVNGYGHYMVEANYKGKFVTAHTSDSECFDWLEDDSNKEKHTDAKRHAYYKIVQAYENKY